MTREEELAKWIKPLAWRRGLRVKGDYTVEVEETTLTREQLTALLDAVLAHLGEGREQEAGCRPGETECLTHGQWLTHCAAGLRAQAATHAEDVRKIQVRMVKVEEALRRLYEETADYIRINHLGDVHHNVSMQMARNALAEIAAPPSAKEERA